MVITAIVIGSLVVATLVGLILNHLLSHRADRLRRAGDHNAADSVEGARYTARGDRAWVPMHDKSFDKPR